ncbi:MAG: D-alanine--D-alanine ligase [Opitutales bacterium]|nr:D-alanine--D-alanine ligase [Opitutales bacterium]
MELTKKTIHITVLSGGVGPERDVSLASGSAVSDALRKNFSVDLVDIDEAKVPAFLDPNNTVIFPVIHGTFGEDGRLQSLLQKQGFSFAGSETNASQLCMNKVRAKKVVKEAGVRVSEDCFFTDPNTVVVDDILRSLGPDLVIKPTDQGSSVALYMIRGKDELCKALTQLSSGNWMIEKRVFGREFTVGVLDHMPLGIVEVIPQGGVYDYKRKYTQGSTDYKFPAILPFDLEEELKSKAMDSFKACGCRDFARVDFIVCEDGYSHFLEVNTLPGLTATSLLPKSASCSGYDFPSLAKQLVQPAINRFSKLNLLPAA